MKTLMFIRLGSHANINIKTADKLRGGAYLPKMRGSITKFINTMGE